MKTATKQATHRITTAEAAGVLAAYDSHAHEPGGILITDTPDGLEAHYTTNPGNIAGRMVMIETSMPLYPLTLRTVAQLAKAINTALDNGDNETAHADALEEDKERDARAWSKFCAQVAARKAAEVREQSDMEE